MSFPEFDDHSSFGAGTGNAGGDMMGAAGGGSHMGGTAPDGSSRAADREFAAQKEQVLKQILTPEARMRLNNIRMVKRELSDLVEQYLIGLATQGKIREQITDDQLKQILLSIQQPKRDFKINRV